MPEPLDVWLGKDEAEGIPSQPRKDLKPPPNWRLEAVAATERPRSLTMGADGRTAVFIQDRDTSDVWLLELDGDGGSPPQRLTTGRDPMPYWEDTEPRLSPDRSTVAYADQGSVWVVAAAGGPPRKLAEAGSPVWLGNDRLVVSVEREDTSRLAVLDVADAWPHRLCSSAVVWRSRGVRRRVGRRCLARRHRRRVRLHATRTTCSGARSASPTSRPGRCVR